MTQANKAPADSDQIAKARETERYAMFQRAKKVAEEMVADKQRGRHRIRYYAEKLRAFAASERQAVIEDCAKIADRLVLSGCIGIENPDQRMTIEETAKAISRAIRSME